MSELSATWKAALWVVVVFLLGTTLGGTLGCFTPSKFYNQFSGVAASEEHVDGVGRLLQSFHDGLAVLQLSEHFPMTELCRGFHEARSIIHDDEALDAETLDQNGGEAGHAGISLGVAGNQAAEDDAAMEIHAAEHRLHDVAADVLKMDVDALGSGCG